MRVSLLNVILAAEDAIGACIINQVRFFRRRGDKPHVYVVHPPGNLPPDIEEVTSVVGSSDLMSGKQEHFRLSDLYVYHYPIRHELMESIRGIERGTIIFYYHNVTPPELWGSDLGREALVQSVKGRALAHYADVCITPSPFNKQDLVERVGVDPERVHVLPLAVPLAEFAPGEKDPSLVQRYGLEGQHVLLFVGRMAGNKRIDLLVEALAKVNRRLPNTRLLLVGDYQGAAAYRDVVAAARSRAQDLGIARDVVWTGRVEELPAYYHLADVYVTASVHEGFGVPLIEAMACGIPVVASSAGAMPWVVGDAGLLFQPENADELAEDVLQVLEDANLRQALAEKGLKRVQAFSLEQYEKGFSEIVEMAATYTRPKSYPDSWVHAGEKLGATTASAAARDLTLLGPLADEAESRSDVSLGGYTVQSNVPVLGPLIAWIRRNMTSHLREPYIDRMIERQVALNLRVTEWLRRAATAGSSYARQQAELEARVEDLEAQVEALARRRDDGDLAKER
jgi:glycosyltransferase involved in cell wall biosynthesis